jgi:hypothetical protein
MLPGLYVGPLIRPWWMMLAGNFLEFWALALSATLPHVDPSVAWRVFYQVGDELYKSFAPPSSPLSSANPSTPAFSFSNQLPSYSSYPIYPPSPTPVPFHSMSSLLVHPRAFPALSLDYPAAALLPLRTAPLPPYAWSP